MAVGVSVGAGVYELVGVSAGVCVGVLSSAVPGSHRTSLSAQTGKSVVSSL